MVLLSDSVFVAYTPLESQRIAIQTPNKWLKKKKHVIESNLLALQ